MVTQISIRLGCMEKGYFLFSDFYLISCLECSKGNVIEVDKPELQHELMLDFCDIQAIPMRFSASSVLRILSSLSSVESNFLILKI